MRGLEREQASAPALRHVARLQVQVAPPALLGELGGRERRIVPILGGSMSLAELSGTILPGGSDIQSVRPDGTIELTARYAVDLGEMGKLMIENTGIRRAIADGNTSAHFHGMFQFDAPAGPLEWLNDGVFISRGYRENSTVYIDVFEVA